jgi:[acyl-carrier-protein] S-malonyltransferase
MIAAMVGASPVTVAEVDAREQQLRSGPLSAALPLPDTSEGRQLRRWLTQLVVAERVLGAEAAALNATAVGAPAEDELLPDVTARLEIGSIAASVLADPLVRSVFRVVTAGVAVTDAEVAAYHSRNPRRFTSAERGVTGWRVPVSPADLADVHAAITTHLLGAARRRAFRGWLDKRSAQLVVLAPGYEHPGDPRQPDNTHKH